jgi:hypothetical protein
LAGLQSPPAGAVAAISAVAAFGDMFGVAQMVLQLRMKRPFEQTLLVCLDTPFSPNRSSDFF